jgi:hypothetical protein
MPDTATEVHFGEDPPQNPGTANWILMGLIVAFGAATFVFAVRTGRADSAVLFVGMPVALAAALAVMPVRTTHGRVFVLTTIGLLLAAVALHEGAICVILAAPLVYLFAHAATAFIRLLRDGQRYLLLVLPLVLVTAIEGTGETLRVHPVQSVDVVRVVALPVDEVAARIEAGPQPAAVRSVPLRLLSVPAPAHVSGDGLAPGDRWTYAYHGGSHGPGGQIITEVSSAAPGAIGFTIVADTTINARWLTWQEAAISWRAVDADHTEVRVSATFTRRLDPSWYFGPLQDLLTRQGMAHLLDMLDIRDPA